MVCIGINPYGRSRDLIFVLDNDPLHYSRNIPYSMMMRQTSKDQYINKAKKLRFINDVNPNHFLFLLLLFLRQAQLPVYKCT